MTQKEKISVLQLVFAGQIIKEFELIRKKYALTTLLKNEERNALRAAPGRLKQLGLHSVPGVFNFISTVPGFAQWRKRISGNKRTYVTEACKLRDIARYTGCPQPCKLYCIVPIEALLKGLDRRYSIEVQSTLWDGEHCSFIINMQKNNKTINR